MKCSQKAVCMASVIVQRLTSVMPAAGLVFFAFAFNMVDCGGILGGRLGNNVNMHAASLKKAKVGLHRSQSVLDSLRASSASVPLLLPLLLILQTQSSQWLVTEAVFP